MEYELSQSEWERLESILPPENHGRGRPAGDNRTKINGMLWIARTDSCWRDLPEQYGYWQTVYSKYRQWRHNGVLEKVYVAFSDDPMMAKICSDLASIRERSTAHQYENRVNQYMKGK